MRSKLTALITCVVLLLDQTQCVRSHIDDLSDLLHDMIGVLEAKHETLEAATVNFRVRASTLNEELVQEQSRCKQLERRTLEDEYMYHDEHSSWRAHVAAAKFRQTEVKYQNQLWKEKTKVSYLEHALLLKNIEVFNLQERLAVMQPSTEKKSEVPEEVAPTNSEETQKHHQEHMRGIIPGAYFAPESISNILTLEESPGLSDTILYVATKIAFLATKSLKYLRDDVAPRAGNLRVKLAKITREATFRSYQKVKILLSWILDESKSCFRGITQTIHEAKTQGIRGFLIRIIQLLSNVSDHISSVFSRAWGTLWNYLSSQLNASQVESFSNALRSLQTMHQLVVIMFELMAVATSRYFMTELSGNRDHWFYKTCLSAKLNSGTMLVMLEVLSGLMAMELALLTLNRSRRRRGQLATKTRCRIAASNSEKPSLLRSSGCLAQSDNSFRSLHTPSLD